MLKKKKKPVKRSAPRRKRATQPKAKPHLPKPADHIPGVVLAEALKEARRPVGLLEVVIGLALLSIVVGCYIVTHPSIISK